MQVSPARLPRTGRDLILVSEIIESTIQGEGPLAGMPCHFVRMAGCDFRCQWCDTPEAVIPSLVKQAERVQTAELASRLFKLNALPEWIVFSGGNPALFELDELQRILQQSGWKVQVETQGSIFRPWLLESDLVVVSPKPPSAGVNSVDLSKFLSPWVGAPRLVSKLIIKIVIFDQEDFNYARQVRKEFPSLPFYLSVGRIPARRVGWPGRAADSPAELQERYRWLAESAVRDFWLSNARVLPQLHVYAWGGESGH